MSRVQTVAFIVLAWMIAPSMAGAQQRAAAPDPVAQTLMKLEDDWCAALVKRDAAVFQRLLANGFVYTEDDRTVDREAVLHDVVASTDTVQAAHNEDMRVHAFGQTAVVTGWLVLQGRSAGKPFTRRYRYTDTWVSQSGQWRIVAAHDYLKVAANR